MRKKYYIHFEKGFSLGFLVELKAFTEKGAHKKVKSILRQHSNKELHNYTLYTPKTVVNLANEHVMSLTNNERVKEISETYLTIWKSTEQLEKSELLKGIKEQLSVMDVNALALMKMDVIGNEFLLNDATENPKEEDELIVEAMVDLIKEINLELRKAKAKLLRLDELTNEAEMRAALEDYFLIVARLKETKKFVKGKAYDWLLDRYFEII